MRNKVGATGIRSTGRSSLIITVSLVCRKQEDSKKGGRNLVERITINIEKSGRRLVRITHAEQEVEHARATGDALVSWVLNWRVEDQNSPTKGHIAKLLIQHSGTYDGCSRTESSELRTVSQPSTHLPLIEKNTNCVGMTCCSP